MARVLTLVGAQVAPVPFDPTATFAKFEDELAVIRRRFPEAQLAIFPELYLTGDDPFTGEPEGFPERVAEAVPGELTGRIGVAVAGAGLWVIAGSILERGGSEVYNTALAYSPEGELVAHHRKTMPWAPFETTIPGDCPPATFDIPGLGRIGLLICYEGWFPEVVRGVALAGAEVIAQPSLTTTPDRAEELVLARANAISNQCYLININAATSIGGGRSIGADPEGRVLFEGGNGEEFFVEAIDLDRVEQVRRHGTRGLNCVWQHFRDAPRSVFEPYRDFLV